MGKYTKINTMTVDDLDKSKKWKPVIDYEDLYMISNYGDVYGIKAQIILRPQLNKEYYAIGLHKNRKLKRFFIHRLVYMTFVNSDIDPNKVIDHIDRNKKNNFVENLREVTYKANSKNRENKQRFMHSILQYSLDNELIKEWDSCKEILENNPEYKQLNINRCCLKTQKSAYGYIWRYRDYYYDQTDFHDIKTDDKLSYSNYKINKDGIVIIKSTGQPVKPGVNVYHYAHLTSDCKQRNIFAVHRLVALTFIPNPNKLPIVNHIDENKINNKMDNLEWCNKKHNSKHSLGKKVRQLDMTTRKTIAEFDTIKEAFESLNKDKGSPAGICKAISKRSKYAFGYLWEYVD
jgi:hypothetical protein